MTDHERTPYAFRLRFELPGAHIESDEEVLELGELPGGAKLELRSGSLGQALKTGPIAAIVGKPFESHDGARDAAERVRQSLLVWAVKNRAGIDLGGRPPRGVVTEYGLGALGKQLGASVRNDIHGIDVYELKGDVRFVRSGVTIEVGRGARTLIDTVREALKNPRTLSDKQLLAGELFAASLFEQGERARFLTLITAVETLLEPGLRPDIVVAMIDDLAAKLAALTGLEPLAKQSALSSLQWLRYESIGQAGRALAERLLGGRVYQGVSPGKFFARCYSLRSELVHNGRPSDNSINILKLANDCQQFVGDLLNASYGSS